MAALPALCGSVGGILGGVPRTAPAHAAIAHLLAQAAHRRWHAALDPMIGCNYTDAQWRSCS